MVQFQVVKVVVRSPGASLMNHRLFPLHTNDGWM